MLDDNIAKKLRAKQANLVKKAHHSISFSRVINETLREALQKKQVGQQLTESKS